MITGRRDEVSVTQTADTPSRGGHGGGVVG